MTASAAEVKPDINDQSSTLRQALVRNGEANLALGDIKAGERLHALNDLRSIGDVLHWSEEVGLGSLDSISREGGDACNECCGEGKEAHDGWC